MISLLIIGLTRVHAAAPPHAITSIYTDLSSQTCQAISGEENEDDEGGEQLQCAGVGGYGLLVVEENARASVTVVALGGKEYPLDFENVITPNFSTTGQKAEWRVRTVDRKPVPIALIVRVNAFDEPDAPEKSVSYLAVAKITDGQICVTDRVEGKPGAGARARKLADTAVARECLDSLPL